MEKLNKLLKKEIFFALKGLEDEELMEIYNRYCIAINKPNLRIYPMFEINNMFRDCSPLDSIRKVEEHGFFSGYEDFFEIDEYGKFFSSTCVFNLITKDMLVDLIDYIKENKECFGNIEIAEILNDDSIMWY